MMPSTPNKTNLPEPEYIKQDEVDLVKLFFIMLSNWYWFALAIVVAVTAAWLYNRHTLPTWRVTASVLIEEDKSSKSMIGADKLLEGFGVRPGMQNLDNQLLILTSWSLIEKTLSALPFGIEYYHKGRINKVAIYPDSPIRVIADTSGSVPKDLEFEFKLLDANTYSLTTNANNPAILVNKARFGDTIEIKGGKLRIEKITGGFNENNIEEPIYFMQHSKDKLIESYRSRLKATPASKEGTIVKLSLDGTNKEMDIDFLSQLIEVFLNNNLERKNQEANRTINFIEDQLIGISDSLTITEDKLQKFRSANKVMDMSVQGQQIIDQAMKLENERAKLVIEANYYEYLAGYLSKDVSAELPVSPATIGITDAGLTKLVIELTDLQSQYFSKSIGQKNPMQTQIAQRLRNTRDALSETLKGVRHANELAMNENTAQIRSINASAVTLPKTERELLGFQREFKLNDVLYSFLLEKMAEAQIQKASNTPDNEVVDKARPDSAPVAPKRSIIYLMALVGGAGFPFLLILLIQALNNVIKSEDDLRKITDLPIAGYIPHNTSESKDVVFEQPSSVVAESFRSLRARIQFFTKEIKSPVILITSSIPGEGKTFTSINLASIYSLMGRKTLLIEFDLRKPSICKNLGIPNERGISTWLIGQDNIRDIIKKTQFSHLDIIPSGPIPPNPAELIDSNKTAELIHELRNLYDFIILDSAPVGTVSDSLALSTFADATIIMVRHGKSISPVLANTITGLLANGISGLSIVMNDINLDLRKYRSRLKYSYQYGYAYQYGYGNQKKK